MDHLRHRQGVLAPVSRGVEAGWQLLQQRAEPELAEDDQPGFRQDVTHALRRLPKVKCGRDGANANWDFEAMDESWKTSKPHLLLLSKFLRGAPAEPNRPSWEELWKPVLGEPRSTAIQRFVEEGVLGPADPAEALQATYLVTGP